MLECGGTTRDMTAPGATTGKMEAPAGSGTRFGAPFDDLAKNFSISAPVGEREVRRPFKFAPPEESGVSVLMSEDFARV